MKYVLQRPLPDEILCSTLIRTGRRFSLPVGSITRMVCGRKWMPGFFQATHLVHFPWPILLSPKEILLRHSIFAYTTAFVDAAVYDACLENSLSTGQAAKAVGALTQSASDLVKWRRYCPRCAKDDIRKWGTSYWHRSHNLPGVTTCIHHAKILLETRLPTRGHRDWQDALPHEVAQARPLVTIPSPFDTQVTKLSCALLSTDTDSRPGYPRAGYRDLVSQLGLLSQGRQANAEQLRKWLRALANAPLNRYDLPNRDLPLNWLQLMLRPANDVPLIALKHVLFRSAVALSNSTHVGCLDHIPTGPSPKSRNADDLRFANDLAQLRTLCERSGRRIRIRDALTELGCWGAFRHARANYPLLASSVRRLRRSVASVRTLKATKARHKPTSGRD